MRSRPHEFFVAGRVCEPAVQPRHSHINISQVFIQMITWQPGSLETNFELQSRVYTGFRRLVVVQDRPPEKYSLCL